MSPASRRTAPRLHPGPAASVGMSSGRLRHVAELARRWVDSGTVQTVEVLVARRATIVLDEAFGRLAPDPDAPSTPRGAIFPLASITKTLTATAVMTLVEEGRVGLNRPVAQYIPEFTGTGKDSVLVRHLLTHTSGLREEEIEKFALHDRMKPVTPPADPTIHPLLQEYYTLRYDAPLWKAPGVEMSYTDLNFDLLGEIVRRQSGTALEEYGAARIFRPLGMVNTYYCCSDAPAARRVRRPPTPAQPGALPDPLWKSIVARMETERIAYGCGSAFSTARDIAAFLQMFLNGGAYGRARVLSPRSVAEMTRNQIPGIGSTFLFETFPEGSWGLGWSVHGSKTGACGGLYSPSSFEHWGAGGTYVWADPELQLLGVYFSVAPITWDPKEMRKQRRIDLFTDAVTAAVVDQ